KKARFDLDRVGSTQYGATNYANVSEAIEGNILPFDENGLTDLQILCYYTYSNLYTMQMDVSMELRKKLLSQLPSPHRCVFSVKPQSVTRSSGQRQQFQAIGAPQAGVKWTSTCGSIDQTGLFTAGNSAGACQIRATSLADSNVFAEATATISGGSTGMA